MWWWPMHIENPFPAVWRAVPSPARWMMGMLAFLGLLWLIGLGWMLLLILCWLVWMGFVWHRRWRVRRAYRAAGGVLCAQCLHPLAGLAYTGRCPECGRPYHPHADAEQWREAKVLPKEGAAERP